MSSSPTGSTDDVRGMDAHALAELVAACQARIAALHAVQARAVGALLTTPEFTLAPDTDPAADVEGGGGEPGEPLVDDLVAELAARLTLTTSAAGTLVTTADRLTRCLPATLGALAAGRTDWARARVVVEECLLLTDDQASYLDEQLTDDLTTRTTGALRARLRTRIDRLDPDAVRRRARRAVADRSVRYHPLSDGIAELLLRGPATDLRCAYEHLTSLAKDTTRPGATTDPHAPTIHHPPDGPDRPDRPDRLDRPDRPDSPPADQRGLDAKRFDAAISALTAPCPTAPGIGAGAGPQIFVHLATALGLDQTSGELIGHGPIPAAHVRALLAHHRCRRIFTDPVTGDITAIDGHSYPPGTIPDLTHPTPTSDTDTDTDTDTADVEVAAADSADDPTAAGTVPAAATPPRRPPQRRGHPGPERDARQDLTTEHATVTPGPPPAPSHPAPSPSAPTPRHTSPAPADATAPANVRQRHPSGDRGATPPERSKAPPRLHPPCPVAAAGGGPYAIPTGTKRLVKVRSRRCTAPGCRTPATRCDTDHVQEWPAGPTCPCNLVPLCRRHHDLKTRRRWHLRKTTEDPRDATVTWTTTLGYHYTVRPEPLLPDPDPSAAPPSRPLPDRLASHYDRGYPTDRPPDPAPGTGTTSPQPADPPRRTWADLPDDPPY